MINHSFQNLQDLKSFIKNENFKKIFVLTGKKSFLKSEAKRLISPMLKPKNTYFYFKKSYYPEMNELKNIINTLNYFNPDLILAVGGGSVLDYAKIARVYIKVLDLKKAIIYPDKFKKNKNLKLVAIPTTAGSGAEVTENAVIYIGDKKYSVEGKEVKPDFFFLIPRLILNSSKKIKSSSGFDAIAQAIESLISNRSTKQSVYFAKKSLELSFRNFENFVIKPNFDNTMKMSIAANLSGRAISISKTTAPHALSYPFTAHFGVPHGHAVSLTLNEFLKFNFLNLKNSISPFSLKKRYNNIFDSAKVQNINELDSFLKKMKSNTGLENNFKKLGISIKKDYKKILSGVNSQRLKNNPIKIKTSDIKQILLNK
jgi:alcohol dehydrogenase